MRKRDLTGHRSGRLLVLEDTGRRNSGGRPYWRCRCDCGNEVEVLSAWLTGSRPTRSCGCLHREMTGDTHRSHGLSGTAEHNIWMGIKYRCYNARCPQYQWYGQRGIVMCDRWLNSFAAFYADMGSRPSARHGIDRLDNDGNYEPRNCRWATLAEQRRNASTTVKLTLDGTTMCLTDWAAHTGVHRDTISRRLARGWTVERALTTPGYQKRTI